jgi:protein O-GlcNAc transferase
LTLTTCFVCSILWSGTPILTWPRHRHKMCSRVAASIVNATGFGNQMTVNSAEAYENRAVELALSVKYETDPVGHNAGDDAPIRRGRGELMDLRRRLYLSRETSALFDTVRWTQNLETAYWEMWRRWVEGTEFEDSDEWMKTTGPEKDSGCIWIEEAL